jgi:hypothetical protein
MRMVYGSAVGSPPAALVLTLNRTCSPTFTLNSVLNPSSVPSPLLVVSHSELGVPGLLFSQTIALGAVPAHGSSATASLATSVNGSVPPTRTAASPVASPRLRTPDRCARAVRPRRMVVRTISPDRRASRQRAER